MSTAVLPEISTSSAIIYRRVVGFCRYLKCEMMLSAISSAVQIAALSHTCPIVDLFTIATEARDAKALRIIIPIAGPITWTSTRGDYQGPFGKVDRTPHRFYPQLEGFKVGASVLEEDGWSEILKTVIFEKLVGLRECIQENKEGDSVNWEGVADAFFRRMDKEKEKEDPIEALD